jgi:FG-GAP-like repeat/FG-GAP repeat
MTSRVGKIWLTIALALCGLAPLATAQRAGAANWPVYEACASANLSGVVAVRAPERNSTPFPSLCDGHPLSTLSSAGPGQPVALASADFDGDGVPDLVSGFSTGKAGKITVHRGNVNALWPYGAALRNGPPPAFLPNPRSFTLPESPDFLVTGDFDADGYWDVVTAQRGSNSLYFLKGDGRGGFLAAQRVQLPGNVTAMVAGEINRADGLADLIVAVNTVEGARALVYEAPTGAIGASPEVFKLGVPATALALGKFDGNAMNDLAVASGSQLVVIHARDRKLSSDASQRADVAQAKVTVQKLPFSIRALAAGDFTGAGASCKIPDLSTFN